MQRWRRILPWGRASDAIEDAEFREFMADDARPVDEVFGERLRRRLRTLVAPAAWKHGIAAGFEATGLNSAGALVHRSALPTRQRSLTRTARATSRPEQSPGR